MQRRLVTEARNYLTQKYQMEMACLAEYLWMEWAGLWNRPTRSVCSNRTLEQRIYYISYSWSFWKPNGSACEHEGWTWEISLSVTSKSHSVLRWFLPVSKRFTTMSTAIRLVSSVRSHMSLQKPGTGESFATNVALVRQVVGQNVHGQGWHADIHLEIHKF